MPVTLTSRDIEAISRVVNNEVGGTPSKDFTAHVKAVVDTMLNRAETNFSNYGGIQGQLNAPLQFSGVNGMPGAPGSWDKLAKAPQKVVDAVKSRLGEVFATGQTQPFLNFANPTPGMGSSPANLRKWVLPMMRDPNSQVIGDPRTGILHVYGVDPTSTAAPPPKVYADFARNALYPGMAADTGDRNAAIEQQIAARNQLADYRQPAPGPLAPELGPPPSDMRLQEFADAPNSQGPSETAQQARARLAQLSQTQRDASYDPTTSPSAMTPGNVAMPSYFGAEFAQAPLAPMAPQAPQVASYDPLSSVRAPFGFAPPTMAGVGPTALPMTLPSYFGAAFSPGSLTPQAPASQGLQAFPELSKAFQEAIKPPVSRAPQVSPGGVSGLTSLGLPSLYQQNKPLGNTWNVLANSGMPSVSQPQPQSYDPLSSVRAPQVPQSTATSGQSYDPLSSVSPAAPRATPYGFDAPSAPTRSASGYDPLSSIRSLPLAQGEGSYSTPALAPSPTYQTQTSYQNVPNPALDSARKALADARARAANYDATPISDYRAVPQTYDPLSSITVGPNGTYDPKAAIAAAQKKLAALPAMIQVPTTVRKLVPQVPQQQPAYDPLSSVRNGGGNPFLNAGMTYLGNAPSGAGQYTNGLSINGVQQVFAGNAPSNALGGMGYGGGSGGGLLSSIGKALGLS